MDLKEHCKLVKKQTILLAFAIMSTFVYFMFAAVSFEGTMMWPVEMLINSVVVWLMFYGQEKYWKCCSKYGFCCCCYLSYHLQQALYKEIQTPRAMGFGKKKSRFALPPDAHSPTV